jgi:hypothetical protein
MACGVACVLRNWLILYERSVDVLPFGVHGRYRLPGVPFDVEPLAARHAHGAIIAPNAVQGTVQGCHPTAAATTAH